MKNLFFALIVLIICTTSMAQNPLSQHTQVEVRIGYVMPLFNKGSELLRAKELRNNEQSYFATANGTRKNVGKYGNSSGYMVSIGFYKPTKIAKGLMLGSLVRNAQTSATPATGGYEEAYFFNFITASFAAKYYPFEKHNLYTKADFGLAAVLTKNRFLNQNNQQNYFHQFGIGNALGVELGYGLTPFKDKTESIEIKVGYQLLNTRVEVNNIGDDNWQFGALNFGLSSNF